MNRIIAISIIFVGLFFGCKKYEDGPCISFRSAKTRIVGDYTLTQYKVDGQDSLSLYYDSLPLGFSFFYNDVNYVYQLTISGFRKDGIGEQLDCGWTLIDNGNTLKLIDPFGSTSGTGPIGSNKTTEWNILRLTDTELKIKADYKDKEYLIELKE